MLKNLNMAIIAFAVLRALSLQALADTAAGGTLRGRNVWKAADSPYLLKSSVIVPRGASLEIEPGTIVKMGAGVDLKVSGSIFANGTADKPVCFIPDANSNGKPWWGAILLQSAADTSVIACCRIDGAGRSGKAAVMVSGAAPRMSMITITNSKYNGIEYDFAASFGEVVLQAAGAPYIFPEGFKLPAGAELFLLPGVRMECGAGKDIRVAGAIKAAGTPSAPVVFSGLDGAGPWGGLIIEGGAAGNSQLQFCEFARGGASAEAQNSSLCIVNSSPVIEYCRFREPAGYGITASGTAIPYLGGPESDGKNDFSAFEAGKYAILNKTKNDFNAMNNCWGGDNPESMIYDKLDNPSRGRVLTGPVSEKCSSFKLAASKIISPAAGSTKQKVPAALRWSSVRFAERYELQAGINEKFDSAASIAVSDTTYLLLNTGWGQKYFWRVRAICAGLPGEWSATGNFKTMSSSLPSAPMLLYPASPEDTVDCTFEFRWREQDDADYYRLEVAADTAFDAVILSVDSISATSYGYRNMNPETRLRWRLFARNSHGLSTAAKGGSIVTRSCEAELPPAGWNHAAQTGSNMMILIRKNVELESGFYHLSPGDALGLFFNDGSKSVCAGYSLWEGDKNIIITAWGDNPQTTDIIEGPSRGEAFSLKIWDAAGKNEMLVSTKFVSGSGDFRPDTIAVVKSLAPPDTFGVLLHPGGVHYLGSPFVQAQITCEKPENVLLREAASGTNNSANIEFNSGKLSYASCLDAFPTQPVMLKFTGDALSAPYSCITASEGVVNILPYRGTRDMKTADALGDNIQRILLIKDDCDRICYPEWGIDEIRLLHPGKYYKTWVKEDTKLCCGSLYAEKNQIIDTEDCTATGSSMVLIIRMENIQDGETITAGDSRGNISGVTKVSSGHAVMIVKGDNRFTAGAKEGPSDGDEISLYSSQNRKLAILGDADNSKKDGITYKTDGVAMIKLMRETTSAIETQIGAGRVEISDCFLSVTMPRGEIINKVSVYNYFGDGVIKCIPDKQAEIFEMPLDGMVQGVYFVLVDTIYGLKSFRINKTN